MARIRVFEVKSADRAVEIADGTHDSPVLDNLDMTSCVFTGDVLHIPRQHESIVLTLDGELVEFQIVRIALKMPEEEWYIFVHDFFY